MENTTIQEFDVDQHVSNFSPYYRLVIAGLILDDVLNIIKENSDLSLNVETGDNGTYVVVSVDGSPRWEWFVEETRSDELNEVFGIPSMGGGSLNILLYWAYCYMPAIYRTFGDVFPSSKIKNRISANFLSARTQVTA